MQIWELFLIAVALSMDAFAVAICEGLSLKKMSYRHAAIIGFFFGGFQALMPLIGYFAGVQFKSQISSIDHWIAFALLAGIGIKMIGESRKSHPVPESTFNLKGILLLSVATSIDALAVGVSFAFLQVNIVPAIAFIGVITFIFSFIGVRIGNLFGNKFQSKAEMAGGIILIAMGLKILLNHLGVINF